MPDNRLQYHEGSAIGSMTAKLVPRSNVESQHHIELLCMSILIVDDDRITQRLLSAILESSGQHDITIVGSAQEAFDRLSVDDPSARTDIDLILMDITMQQIDGLEACRRIKTTPHLTDIPIIIVTGRTEAEDLEVAFEAGAMDYVAKPFNRITLMARVHGALRLKHDLDRRKERERELLEARAELEAAKQQLERISTEDALTGIANRRNFDQHISQEQRRALRHHSLLSLLLIDIDRFKVFNDTYGHTKGDECLRTVAQTLASVVKRPRDLVARYGGEEFVVVLPETDTEGALFVAEEMRAAIANLGLPHKGSERGIVTVSIGVATARANGNFKAAELVETADRALYEAKQRGRDRIVQTDMS